MFNQCERWLSTWHRFHHYDREGVGRRAGHSSWCFFLSLLHPPGKSPLSWPEVPWYSQWISLLPLHSHHASPSGMKYPQEIWVQRFPGKEKKKKKVINDHLVIHSKSHNICSHQVLTLQLKTGSRYQCVNILHYYCINKTLMYIKMNK